MSKKAIEAVTRMLDLYIIFRREGKHEYARRTLKALECLRKGDVRGAQKWVVLVDTRSK